MTMMDETSTDLVKEQARGRTDKHKKERKKRSRVKVEI